MNLFSKLNFSNSFYQLSPAFYQEVSAQAISEPVLASINPTAAALIGLSSEQLQEDDFLALMSGQRLPKQGCSIATVYGGHQFGHYNPQLGDGRALLIGEITTDKHELWELQLKGSGQTPYSRQGDGRAVLRSSLREYLCCEAMHGLGIATTRAMALAFSKTPVYRESIETAATVLRMAPSFIRFGHFEYFYYQKQYDELKQLLDFTIAQHFADLLELEEKTRYQHWFSRIVQLTADMVAQWQAAGFCHGVMNSDNMSILGLTLDYGPFAFLDEFDPTFICNHSDHDGRYAYNQQANIALWNLNALAHSLSPIMDLELLKDILKEYEPLFLLRFKDLMRLKTGLKKQPQQPLPETLRDDVLITEILQLLAKEQRDYTNFFRLLSHYDQGMPHSITLLREQFTDTKRFTLWLQRYQQRLDLDATATSKRQEQMLGCNPKYILRNYLAQLAIEKARDGHFKMIDELLTVLHSPFDEQPEFEHFANTPPDWAKELNVGCSS